MTDLPSAAGSSFEPPRPPGPPGPPGPARRSLGRGRVAAIVAGTSDADEPVQPVRDAVDSFLGCIEAGDLAGAYAQLPLATRTGTSLEVFTFCVKRQPFVRHAIGDVEVTGSDGLFSARVGVQLFGVDGRATAVEFPMVKIGDSWAVSFVPF